jgi:hypothetical protein
MQKREPKSLSDLLDRLSDSAESETVAIRDVVNGIGRGSMIPFLLVPAFLTATPLSGIPGVSTMSGLIIAIVSFRLLLNYDSMALPDWIARRSFGAERLRNVLSKSEPVVNWIDRHTRRRWDWMFERPVIWIPEALCLLSGLMMPLLEFVPFTSSFVAVGVFMLALSMLLRDGLLFLIALLPYAAMIYLVVPRFF